VLGLLLCFIETSLSRIVTTLMHSINRNRIGLNLVMLRLATHFSTHSESHSLRRIEHHRLSSWNDTLVFEHLFLHLRSSQPSPLLFQIRHEVNCRLNLCFLLVRLFNLYHLHRRILWQFSILRSNRIPFNLRLLRNCYLIQIHFDSGLELLDVNNITFIISSDGLSTLSSHL
jgi:hypothetical protein